MARVTVRRGLAGTGEEEDPPPSHHGVCASVQIFDGAPSRYSVWLFAASVAVAVTLWISAVLILPSGRTFKSDRERILGFLRAHRNEPMVSEEVLGEKIARAFDGNGRHYWRMLRYLRNRGEIRVESGKVVVVEPTGSA
jgi:hypothetical protein